MISQEFPIGDSRSGGIGTYTVTTADALSRRGHEVSVVTRGPDYDARTGTVRVVGIDHRWLPSPSAQRLLAARTVAQTVRRLRPDVVIGADWAAEAWWLARFGGPPLVTVLHTPTYLVEQLNDGGVQRRTGLVRRMERDQTARSAAIVAPTRALANRVAGDWALDARAIEVVPNGLDVDRVRRAGAGEPGLELPRRFVAYLGRLERRKGVESLAEALPAALADHPDVHALFIGRDTDDVDGSVLARLRPLLAPLGERVSFVGELPHDRAMAVLARAELVVLPSLWENHPYTATEAAALGRPVVATAEGGFPEIIADGETGRLVAPGDARALVAGIREALADEARLRQWGAAASRRAAELDCDRMAERLERVLLAAVGRAR